jgi:hypothetical protein
MDKIIKKSNKGNLKNRVLTNLDKEFASFNAQESNSNISQENKNDPIKEYNEVNTKKVDYKLQGPRYNKVREKGDWEAELSETAPLREGIGRRVSRFKKLPNGLTPYEMMYGKQDNDFDILNKSLE